MIPAVWALAPDLKARVLGLRPNGWEPLRFAHRLTSLFYDRDMKRFQGLLRDTWMVWLLFIAGGSIAGIFLPVFFVAIPISIVSFLYFGFMRYDSSGAVISEDHS